jgi:hypothetical protein
LCAGKSAATGPDSCTEGPAIDAQAAAVVEIDEQAADLRIEQDVAKAHEGAVAVEIGKGETASVENADQARATALERTIAAAIRRTGGEKEEGRSQSTAPTSAPPFSAR